MFMWLGLFQQPISCYTALNTYRTTGLELSLQEMTQKCRHLEETAIDPQEN